MFDRMFSSIRKDKRKSRVIETPKTGQPSANGQVDGLSKPPAKVQGAVLEKSPTEATGKYPEPPDHGDSRVDIDAMLNSFAGLISHSMRPLPEQTGDGTYIEDEVHSSFFKDLSTIGIKDLKTLTDKIEAGKEPIEYASKVSYF